MVTLVNVASESCLAEQHNTRSSFIAFIERVCCAAIVSMMQQSSYDSNYECAAEHLDSEPRGVSFLVRDMWMAGIHKEGGRSIFPFCVYVCRVYCSKTNSEQTSGIKSEHRRLTTGTGDTDSLK